MTTVRSSPPVMTTGRSCFLENRGEAFGVWREPFTELRVPLLFNLRRDPFEKAQHNSNTYNDWFLDRAFVLVPIQALAAQFLQTMKDYPPEPVSGLVQPQQDRGAIKGGGRTRRTVVKLQRRPQCLSVGAAPKSAVGTG